MNQTAKIQEKSWHEKDGIIYFSVTSDGTTGEDWITRLENKGFPVADYPMEVLRSSDFKPTKGLTTEVAVLKGMLFEDNDRIIKKIYAEGVLRNLSRPKAEVACLIREKFTDEDIADMGMCWIATMHEPISSSDTDDVPALAIAFRAINDRCRYENYGKSYSDRWNCDCGFAFAVSQTPTS